MYTVVSTMSLHLDGQRKMRKTRRGRRKRREMKEEENNAGKKRKKVDGDDSDGDNGYKNSDNNTLKSDGKKSSFPFVGFLRQLFSGRHLCTCSNKGLLPTSYPLHLDALRQAINFL